MLRVISKKKSNVKIHKDSAHVIKIGTKQPRKKGNSSTKLVSEQFDELSSLTTNDFRTINRGRN